jgi:HSP20 family protein
MAVDRAQQQREENPTRGTRSSSEKQADTSKQSESLTGRGEQERAIRTGRETSRPTGTTPRQLTSPIYSLEGGQFTPFTMMRRIAEDMERMVDNFGLGRGGLDVLPAVGTNFDRGLSSERSLLGKSVWSPQVEMLQRGDKLVVRADLPGLAKDDVNVEIDDGMLAISGERREEHEEGQDDFYRSERTYGRFYRAIPLPEGIDENQCDASFRDGVLEVTLAAPKQETRRKQIPVR